MFFSLQMPAISVCKILYLLYNKYFWPRPIYLYVLAQYLHQTACNIEHGLSNATP